VTKRLVQIGVLALCLYLLWRNVDWQEAAGLLRAADWRWLLAAVLLLTLQTILSAERWRITAAQLGITFPFRHALREYYLSQVVNQSLPGGVIGDAGRAVRNRDQGGLLAAGQAVLFERLAGQLGLLALLTLGLILGLIANGDASYPDWFHALCATLLSSIAVACLAVITIVRGPTFISRPMRRATAAFSRAIFGPRVWRAQVALSGTTAACNVAAFAFCALAIGVPLGIATSILLIPLVLFAMVIPLSIGGWGLREGAAAILFPVFGATSGEGLAASVAFGLMILLSLAPGLILAGAGGKHAYSAR